jgi:Prokaryotic phospholipase A2
MRRTVLLVGAALVLAAGSFVGSLDPAEATTQPGVNATPYNNSSHPWTTDGCSVVPDSGIHTAKVAYGSYPFLAYATVSASWNFNHACIHHDGCYRNHWASRGTCDSWFLNDMRASCSAIHPSSSSKRAVCNDKAAQYYAGVRAFGGPAYNGWSHYIPFF